MNNKWFVIINPVAGNGASKKKWTLIYNELLKQTLDFDFEFTKHKNHAVELVENAINSGFTKFICVGGDGTLHTIVNGILKLNLKDSSEIKVGIIPIGTGNDWVKTYNIPKNYKKAIEIIKAENSVKQDIGKLTIKTSNKPIYFNNLAGIGFDGYVVYKVNNYKKLGFLAYLVGALVSLTSFKKPHLEILFNNKIIKGTTLMLLIGLCKFSGGGMQLTKNADSTDGFFDISFIQKITLFQLLKNIPGLFNGNITNHPLVQTYKTASIKIRVKDNQQAYIQADGELIGLGDFNVSLLPKAIRFMIPS